MVTGPKQADGERAEVNVTRRWAKDAAGFSVSAVLCAVCGIWAGGDISHFLYYPPAAFLCLVLAVAVGIGAHKRSGRIWVGACGLIMATMIAGGGWHVGSRHASDAFNDAVRNGESVRKMLDSYKQRTGEYPRSISDLDGPVSGEFLIFWSVWDYESDGSGYTLQVGDWMVTHKATHRSGFVVGK